MARTRAEQARWDRNHPLGAAYREEQARWDKNHPKGAAYRARQARWDKNHPVAVARDKWNKNHPVAAKRNAKARWDKNHPVATAYRDHAAGVPLDKSMPESAFALMSLLLKDYGLGSLADNLERIVRGGVTDEASIMLLLQDTAEWKERFVGNEALRKNGLPVLSVSEYLATERSYAQIMKNFGLPKGFYDDPADFGGFIGSAVSASELQERVQVYSDLANREDPAIKAQLASMGMSDGDLLAFAMDPTRANPLIQQKYKTALIGGAARRTGLVADNAYAAKLAGMGLTEEQAQAGYGVISENLADVDRLGEIYGVDYDQRDFESEVFEGDGKATKKRKGLASQERAAFGGSSGVGSGSLTQSTAGQY